MNKRNLLYHQKIYWTFFCYPNTTVYTDLQLIVYKLANIIEIYFPKSWRKPGRLSK